MTEDNTELVEAIAKDFQWRRRQQERFQGCAILLGLLIVLLWMLALTDTPYVRASFPNLWFVFEFVRFLPAFLGSLTCLWVLVGLGGRLFSMWNWCCPACKEPFWHGRKLSLYERPPIYCPYCGARLE